MPSFSALRQAPRLAFALALIAALCWAPRSRTEEPSPATWLEAKGAAWFEPSATRDASGQGWVAWISHTPRGARLWCGVPGPAGWGPTWGTRVVVQAEGVFPATPLLAPFGPGVLCVWEGDRDPAAEGDPGRSLYARSLWMNERGAIERSEIVVLTAPDERALNPSLVVRAADELRLAYQRSGPASYDLVTRGLQRSDDGLVVGSATRIVGTPADEWRPRFAKRADDQGHLHLVYDYFEPGSQSYDVAWLKLDGERIVEHRVVANTAAFEAYPDCDLDPAGRLWITFETAPQFGRRGPLRAMRQLALRAIQDGHLHEVALDWKTIDGANRHESPQLWTSSKGLYLSYRTQGTLPPALSQSEEFAAVQEAYASWQTTLLTFDAGGQPRAQRLLESDGGPENSCTVLSEGAAATLVLASDRRSQLFEKKPVWPIPIEERWALAVYPNLGSDGFPELGPAAELLPRTAVAPRPDRPETLFGDLHLHTHVSRCAGFDDGTTEDVIRYARGPGRLDFLAITDHIQHLQPWSAWRAVRDANRYHDPGRLVHLLGIERMIPGQGHQNLIVSGARQPALFDPRKIAAEVADLPIDPEQLLAIPHMMGAESNPFPRAGFVPKLHRVHEVFQGYRGSYEGRGPYPAADADARLFRAGSWGREPHLGWIAASDHESSGTSYAGLPGATFTRTGILAALRDRHTFAATIPRTLDVTLDSIPMGGRGAIGPSPELTIQSERTVDGSGPVLVDVIVNGELAHRHPTEPARGSTRRERLILTSRAWRSQEDVRVRVEDARILNARFRRGPASGLELERIADHTLLLRRDRDLCDVVFEAEVAEGAEPQVTVERDGVRRRFALDELPRFESLAVQPGEGPGYEPGALYAPSDDEADRPQEWLTRLGPPLELAPEADSFTLPVTKLTQGDQVYVRVGWPDGNVAWSSPILVSGTR